MFRVGAGANRSLAWQASPWGEWEVGGTPIVLDGVNCTLHTITNADGRFGANDSSIQYAPPTPLLSLSLLLSLCCFLVRFLMRSLALFLFWLTVLEQIIPIERARSLSRPQGGVGG